MSDSRFLIEVRITHEQPLTADAQTIADLAARALTDAFSADPKLLATAIGQRGNSNVVFSEGYADGFRDGKLIAIEVIEKTLPPVDQLHRIAERERRREEQARIEAEAVEATA